jgi:uncharacterized protein (TIGR03435 family)
MAIFLDALNRIGSSVGGLFDIPIVDQTGLQDEYDVELKFAVSPPLDHPDMKISGPGSPTLILEVLH